MRDPEENSFICCYAALQGKPARARSRTPTPNARATPAQHKSNSRKQPKTHAHSQRPSPPNDPFRRPHQPEARQRSAASWPAHAISTMHTRRRQITYIEPHDIVDVVQGRRNAVENPEQSQAHLHRIGWLTTKSRFGETTLVSCTQVRMEKRRRGRCDSPSRPLV
jgi:hypothetical protein